MKQVMKAFALFAAVVLLVLSFDPPTAAQQPGLIRLLIRADDIGSSHAANVACIKAFREGIARSVEIMVPAPWFREAVKMLNENQGCDVGVHLTLTSEWELYKWRPLTLGPSLVDREGNFYPTSVQRADFPPGTGLIDAKPHMDEVEKELRAQIELAKSLIPSVSHLSSHMGTPTWTPELRRITDKLAREYGLPLETNQAKPLRRVWSAQDTPEQKEAKMVNALENLEPGTWIFVEHPGLDTEEMRSIGHKGYWNVAQDRDGVTRAFTSTKVKEVVARRNIELIGYKDLSQPTPAK